MRLVNIVIPVSIIVILSGCVNAQKPERSTSESSIEVSNVPDTLINSFPLNYLKALDALNDSSKYEVRSYKDLLELFENLNYTPESWQAGIREIPRVYLTIIGDRWGSTTTKEITVEYKKRIFFRGLAPLILRANELIMLDRNRLEKIRSSIQANTSLPEMDQTWILKLAKLYKVKTSEDYLIESMLEELWVKVDITPASLALAQGAEESGWGTSRFAAEGNAIYGQWTWGGEMQSYLKNNGRNWGTTVLLLSNLYRNQFVPICLI